MEALSRKRQSLDGKQKGFTLIELLVVVLIIGILAAVAIPIFLGQQDSAKDSAVESAITNAKTAVVAQLVTGTQLSEIATETLTDLPTTVAGYTASDDITVQILSTGTTAEPAFTISGFWTESGDGPASATNHGHSITDKGAATKIGDES